MAESKTYTIKEITKLTENNASTLRYYEDMGLLENVERDKNGNRIYSREHLDRLIGIKCFKDGAMSLSKIKEFYTFESDPDIHIDDILKLLQQQTEELSETINKMQAQKLHMEHKVQYYTAVKKSIEAQKPWPSWEEFFKDN